MASTKDPKPHCSVVKEELVRIMVVTSDEEGIVMDIANHIVVAVIVVSVAAFP